MGATAAPRVRVSSASQEEDGTSLGSRKTWEILVRLVVGFDPPRSSRDAHGAHRTGPS